MEYAMTDNMQSAREILAEEFRRELWHADAAEVMAGEGDQIYGPALRAIDAALRLAVPAGWVMVPREPTAKMMAAGWMEFPSSWGNGDKTDDGDAANCYRAMLAAAPTVSAEGEG